MMNIIHIGFPKTATTLLRQSIFPQLPPHINYIHSQESRDLFFKLCNEDDSILDFGALKSAFMALCSKKIGTVNLFSYEPLTGLHYQTGFINRTLIAKRLKRLGFKKVIITIRNQYDILDSAYRQYIKNGGVLRFNKYFNFNNTKGRDFFYLDYYNYHNIIALYSNIFDFNNLCILQYEELNKGSFFASLADFLEIPNRTFSVEEQINRSISVRATNTLRIINHFTYNTFRPSHLISKKISTGFFFRLFKILSVNSGKETFINNKYRRIIHDYFKDSNKKLVNQFNIDLDSSYPQ